MTTVHPSDDTSTSRVAPIMDDLRQLMALRSRSALRDRPFPALFELLPPSSLASREGRFTALVELIEDGLSQIDDPDHRQAAIALFAFDAGRWRNLSLRGGEAAAVFGCGWDAYRRRRTAGHSHLDDTVNALALALEAQRGAHTAPDAVLVGTATAPVERTADLLAKGIVSDAPRHRKVRSLMFAILAIGIAGALVVVITVAGADAPDERTTPPVSEDPAARKSVEALCSGLAHEVGSRPAIPDAALDEWATRFIQTAKAMENPPECADLMRRENGTIVQPVTGGLPSGFGIGALMASEVGGPHVVLLSHSQFFGWRSLHSKYGHDAIGDPIDRVDENGVGIARFTNGGIINEAFDGAGFWVLGPTWQRWVKSGGLEGWMGRPASSPYDRAEVGRVQDFAKGQVIIDFQTGGFTWHKVPDPAGDLPPDHRQSVLIAADGVTSWYIDEEGRRHWLPSSSDFLCATDALGSAIHKDVPGWAIVTLEMGAPFRCR